MPPSVVATIVPLDRTTSIREERTMEPILICDAELVDWHEMAALAARGCSPELALEVAR
jgi:hypothetical protein